jgi:hypothetical protein
MVKLFLIILFSLNIFADFLVYDKAHSSYITDMIYHNGQIITVSRDGTLRVWDKDSFDETIYYAKKELGHGNFYAVAADDDYILASGGLYQPIPIYIFKSKLFSLEHIKTLSQSSDIINAIDISKDNTKFIATAVDSLYIYSLKNFKLIKRIPFYKMLPNNDIYDVKFLDKNQTVFVTRTLTGGKVVIFDIDKEKIIAQKELGYHLWSVDVVGDKIFTAGYNEDWNIEEFDFKLNYITKFNTHDDGIYKLNHKGNYLLASGKKAVYLYRIINGYLLDLVKKIEVNDRSMANTFLDNSVYGDINFAYADGNILKINNKPYESVKSNILKPQSVAIGKSSIHINSFYKFDFKKFKILNSANKTKHNSYKNKDFSFKIDKTYNGRDTIIVYKNSKIYSKIIRNFLQGYYHVDAKWYKDYIASIGEYGHFYIYKKSGEIALELLGSSAKLIDFDIKDNFAVAVDVTGIIYFWDLLGIDIQNSNNKEILCFAKMVIDKNRDFAIFDDKHFYTTSNRLLLTGTMKDGLYKDIQFVDLKKSDLKYFKKLFSKKSKYEIFYAKNEFPLNIKDELFFVFILKDKKHLLISDDSNLIKIFDIEKEKVTNLIKIPKYERIYSFYQEDKDSPIFLGTDHSRILKIDNKEFKVLQTDVLPDKIKVKHINIVGDLIFATLERIYPKKYFIQIYDKSDFSKITKFPIEFDQEIYSKIEMYHGKLYFSSIDDIYEVDLKNKRVKKFIEGYLVGRYKNYLLSNTFGEIVSINLENSKQKSLKIDGGIKLFKDKVYVKSDDKVQIFDIKNLKLLDTIPLKYNDNYFTALDNLIVTYKNERVDIYHNKKLEQIPVGKAGVENIVKYKNLFLVIKTSEIDIYDKNLKLLYSFEKNRFNDFIDIYKDKIMMLEWKNIVFRDFKGKIVKKIKLNNNTFNVLSTNLIKNNLLYLATFNNLYIVDLKKEKVLQSFDKKIKLIFLTKKLHTIYLISRDNNLYKLEKLKNSYKLKKVLKNVKVSLANTYKNYYIWIKGNIIKIVKNSKVLYNEKINDDIIKVIANDDYIVAISKDKLYIFKNDKLQKIIKVTPAINSIRSIAFYDKNSILAVMEMGNFEIIKLK